MYYLEAQSHKEGVIQSNELTKAYINQVAYLPSLQILN